ncbi:hypothetical protein TrVE_jg1811 [Triparma verrucosa]|uniref:Sulfotransferase n=1 Tax=Triparma verrucosa TaxID=1606542 RepID=A0A9W7BZV5_9STRA|nr:hypothetical protein TrVE_jg1811 [Triparma verrucosa]
MHRSGTSLLAGLLSETLGIPVGPKERLIQPNFDNVKGFYELRDAVLANDAVMKYQRRDYGNVENIDVGRGGRDVLEVGGGVRLGTGERTEVEVGRQGWKFSFRLGESSIKVWDQYPIFLQKDPRMCLMLAAWFPFFSSPPAAIFTYRNPLEVAKSMNKRDGNDIFPVSRGLTLWLQYTRAALENVKGLCTVYTSASKVFAEPVGELERIREDMVNVCGVELKRDPISVEKVNEFIDVSLQHQHARESKEHVLGERGCEFPVWSSEVRNAKNAKREEKLYEAAMQIFCDLESGYLYDHVDDYEWPNIVRYVNVMGDDN